MLCCELALLSREEAARLGVSEDPRRGAGLPHFGASLSYTLVQLGPGLCVNEHGEGVHYFICGTATDLLGVNSVWFAVGRIRVVVERREVCEGGILLLGGW